jgi:hypothetical protein
LYTQPILKQVLLIRGVIRAAVWFRRGFQMEGIRGFLNTPGFARRRIMKKPILIVALSFVLWVAFAASGQSQTAGEFTEWATITYSGNAKTLSLGKDLNYVSYEVTGVVVNDTGEGLFHGATVRCLGEQSAEKGEYERDRGSCICNLMNGDKVFLSYKATGDSGIPSKGTATILGATGSYSKGVQGGYGFTGYSLRPAIEGIIQSFVRAKFQYRLP